MDGILIRRGMEPTRSNGNDQADVSVECEKVAGDSLTERSAIAALSGALVGRLVGFARNGEALIDLPDHSEHGYTSARSCIRLGVDDIGKEVVVVLGGRDPALPIIVGLIQRVGAKADTMTVPPAAPQHVEVDGRKIELRAQEAITLRCGDASITLTKDGKIVIRGAHVVSHAAGLNRIRGGSIQLN
jgi:hypothetical protein